MTRPMLSVVVGEQHKMDEQAIANNLDDYENLFVNCKRYNNTGGIKFVKQ